MAVFLANDQPAGTSVARLQDACPDVLQDGGDGPGTFVVSENFVRQMHVSAIGLRARSLILFEWKLIGRFKGSGLQWRTKSPLMIY